MLNRRLFLLSLAALPLRSRGQDAAASAQRWPAKVLQPEVQPVAAGLKDGHTVFETAHYSFTVETDISPALMKRLARAAEGTRRLWRALPLDLPPPETTERSGVRILRNAASYQAAGGPAHTAGFFRYTRHDPAGRLLVNAEALGVDTFNGRTSAGTGYQPSVLIHELSHQATAAWLPYLPLWLREGLAEYGALIPWADGVFRLDADSLTTALRRRCALYRASGDDPFAQRKPGLPDPGALGPWLMPLSDLLRDESAQARLVSGDSRRSHSVYLTSLLTVFYLLHLAPPATPGGERPLPRYLRGLTACLRHYVRDEPGISLPEEIIADPPRDYDFHSRLASRLWAGATPPEVWSAMQAVFARLRVPLTP